ncbi:macrolide-specific efflux system membrane fusion protein [Cohnella phaseoli]|uniref:Macrolide-specific efflux system membrane fusion protein n=1 Tax=Cohnella phaseoli TaxID=456490 RepID=A0A3D9JRV8_9BACL|nr:macrolide-specific efflux system membrane fusion protein [Cohnella phaseoli]
MSRILRKVVTLGIAFSIGGALAGCSLLPKEEEALKPPLVKPKQENYKTVAADKGSIIKSINGSGVFESEETSSAQFSGQGGRIDKILVKSGDKVKKGDLLAQLIVDGLDIQLKEQQLALEKAKYAFRNARDSDEQAFKIAGLQVEVEQLKYDRLDKQFNSKQLISEIDGQVVFAETLVEGDFVEPYQTLVTIADPSNMRLALRADSGDSIKDVQVGLPVEVTYKGEKITGTVTQTPSSAPETTNQRLTEKYARTLYIDLPSIPKEAKIGSIADVKIVTEQRDDVVKIPRSGLRSYLGRNFVRVLEDDQKLREVDVEPGLVGSTEVEIVQGLKEGQLVVLQ